MQFITCLLLAVLLASGYAARILMLPQIIKNNVNFFTVARKELQSRGHEVVLLAPQMHKYIMEEITIPINLNDSTETKLAEWHQKFKDHAFTSGFTHLFNLNLLITELTQIHIDICYEVMQNKEVMKALQDHKFDIALVDGTDPARCMYLIPYKLNISYITLTTRNDPWRAGLPSMPAVEGLFGTFIVKPESSYIQILKTVALSLVVYICIPPPPLTKQQLKDLAPEKIETTYNDLYKASEVFLVNLDNTCMDYPKISAPHYQFIGGVSVHPAKPLSKTFERFVHKAKEGLIVVSFGTYLNASPEIMDKMLQVFRLIRQFVVMKYDGHVKNVPENVMLAEWLPQNDLLGHPKTRLFIAHGGNSGQTEALYHATPMIVMPFVNDQMYSAVRAEEKQFGKFLDPFAFTIDQLHATIKEVLSNPVYAQNMKKCSEISRSFPSSHEQINFWVEHVVKFGGGSHLKPISLEMPLYRMFMLDVLAIILLMEVGFFYAAYKCCKCTCRKCSSQSKTKRD